MCLHDFSCALKNKSRCSYFFFARRFTLISGRQTIVRQRQQAGQSRHRSTTDALDKRSIRRWTLHRSRQNTAANRILQLQHSGNHRHKAVVVESLNARDHNVTYVLHAEPCFAVDGLETRPCGNSESGIVLNSGLVFRIPKRHKVPSELLHFGLQ